MQKFIFTTNFIFKGCLSGNFDRKAQFTLRIAVTDWKRSTSTQQDAESSSDETTIARGMQKGLRLWGPVPGNTHIVGSSISMMKQRQL